MTDSCKKIFGSSHHSVFTWKIALRTVLWVREFEPSLLDPGVYFNIKCIGKLSGPTNEFERSQVFETGEFERPKFDCILENFLKKRTLSKRAGLIWKWFIWAQMVLGWPSTYTSQLKNGHQGNPSIGTSSSNFVEFRGIRPGIYIKDLLW